MKKIIVLLVVVLFTSANAFAKNKFYEVDIYFTNGEVKSGFAEWIGGYSETISFKQNEDVEVEEIEFLRLKKIIYKKKGKVYEYWYLKVYKGWGQKKIAKFQKWLLLLKEGHVNLYRFNTQMNVGFGSISSSNFTDYYCLREQEGEKAAKWISAVAGANNNQMFRAKAPLYFADYPELAKKIKDKEYKWDDLYDVIDIYNKWKKE